VLGDSVNFIDPTGLSKFGAIKKALQEIYKLLNINKPMKPKGKGKYGSPMRGDSKKGYRLDKGHSNRPKGDPECGDHINYWDYTKGKRGKGGKSGAVPINNK